MFYSLTSILVFLLLPLTRAQGGVFDPNWGANSANQIQKVTSYVVSKATSSGNVVSIVTKDGVTSDTATIGGRPHTTQFPAGASISTSTSSLTDSQGQLVEEFTIEEDGKSYTYKTHGGRTMGPPGGGPFKIS
ncbi:hypothetical protein GCK32_022019 [Trichostrongylus colubriformis]|uniref:Uncharacterized protein n=1 Tax=Trichostrongylus colubriformis TaxID=6319 RepID=A0AAN8FFM5_TRICO